MRKQNSFQPINQSSNLTFKKSVNFIYAGIVFSFLSLALNNCSSSKKASVNPPTATQSTSDKSSPDTSSSPQAVSSASTAPSTDSTTGSTSAHGPKFIQTFDDCKFDSARIFVQNYCAACHSIKGSTSKSGEKARRAITMDTYAGWMEGSKGIPGRIDRDHLTDDIMPPSKFPAQPTDAERKTVVEWVRRGSPNTESGR